MRILLFLTFFAFMPLPAVAQDDGQISTPQTRIEIDDVNHVIRFFIKGEETARLTEDGFEVIGDVAYGGTIRDQGHDGFKNNLDDHAEAADAP